MLPIVKRFNLLELLQSEQTNFPQKNKKLFTSNFIITPLNLRPSQYAIVAFTCESLRNSTPLTLILIDKSQFYQTFFLKNT